MAMLEKDAHSCKRYHLQIDNEKYSLAKAIDYMAMYALWDPHTVARPQWGDIVVFHYAKGYIMLG